MTPAELKENLSLLGLTQAEAAQLLDVNPRTVRRWVDGTENVPGPVEQAVDAWRRLQVRGIPWRPDSVSIFSDDQHQIALHKEHAKQMDAILTKVEHRGGPRLPWTVDRDRCRAVLGPVEVSFYRLANGSFTPSWYRRTDGPPNIERDRELIEDAIFCFAKKTAKASWRKGF